MGCRHGCVMTHSSRSKPSRSKSSHPCWCPPCSNPPLYARYALAEGRPADPMQVIDELVKVRCSQLSRLDRGLRVFATFPETGLTGVPFAARKEQSLHLLDLVASDRVRVNMVPSGSILAGVTSPFQIYRLRDGSRVATSEHTNGTIVVHDTRGVQRLQDLARAALGNGDCSGLWDQLIGSPAPQGPVLRR